MGLRAFIGDKISIDGRMIGFRIETAADYLELKEELDETEIDEFINNKNEIYTLINQILAVKHSCWLLRRTSYSCQSLADNMYDLKFKLISELEEKHNFIYDDEFVDKYCE